MNLDKLLMKVEKPSRYTGGEWNACYKEIDEETLRVAFCFPDVYEVGMSHLGLRILYEAVNRLDGVYLERFFAPWIDMEELLKQENVPLFSLETKTPLSSFDVIGFTLQYEMSFTNILNMLSLGNVPLLAKDRNDLNFPLVVMGGPCVTNPESLHLFGDVFLLGDGEDSLPQIVEIFKEYKAKGKSKQEYLEEIAHIEGVYIPSFYEVIHDENGKISSIEVINSNANPVVHKALVSDINSAVFPENCIVPNMGIVHDRVTLEIMRGCTRGCRFCQAGYIYRPVREKNADDLIAQGKTMIDNTGYSEISLSSLSSSDYSGITKVTGGLMDELSEKYVSVALPSLRLDNFSRDVIKNFPKVRKTGLTFAPEAGSQRLRDVINKNVTEEDLRKTVATAFELGWHRIKLYFMIGLPTETMEDIEGIVKLANAVVDEYYKVNGKKRGLTLTVSTSTFVPKSNTPFFWFGQDTMENIKMKQDYLKSNLRDRWFKYSWHDPKISMLEAVFARGGRELSPVLLKAHELGCKFDSWSSVFDFDAWLKAFSECGLDPYKIATKNYDDDEILPFDMLSYNVTKKFLLKEKERALKAITVEDCRNKCIQCGLMKVCDNAK